MPQMAEMRVVLPAPFGPNKARISPFLMLRVILSRATKPLAYCLPKLLISIIFIHIPRGANGLVSYVFIVTYFR